MDCATHFTTDINDAQSDMTDALVPVVAWKSQNLVLAIATAMPNMSKAQD